MSTLLERQRKTDHAGADTNLSYGGGSIKSEHADRGDWSTSPLELPNLNTRSAYAASAKAAARLNATSVTAREHESLLSERQELLDKLFSGEITKQEQNRLEYVRWSLDRIEDARHGASLDLLEAQAEAYENFKAEVGKFYDQLNARIATHRR